MKCLTIWQPWASLILVGAKPWEFRSWKPPQWLVGQRMGIHAGSRKVKKDEVLALIAGLRGIRGFDRPCLIEGRALELLDKVAQGYALPLGAMIGTAVVGDPMRGDECAREIGIEYGGNDSDRPYTFNWGWPMLDVKPLLPPREMPGHQGLWDFEMTSKPHHTV